MPSGDDPYLSTELIEHLLARGSLRAVFQPVVDLRSGAVAGYEAFARGPEGTPLETPEQLFAAARVNAHVPDLDWACRAAAVEGALGAGVVRPLALFVNLHPDAIGAPCPSCFVGRAAPARELRVIFDLPERALRDRPAALLAEAERLRARGWGVALDHVSGDPDALALLPYLDPDIIKIDLDLLQHLPYSRLEAVAAAVTAQARRSGAVVFAEGVSDESRRSAALDLGATVGSGFLLGAPCAGPVPTDRARDGLALSPRFAAPPAATPFALVRGAADVQVVTKAELALISLDLERRALAASGRLVVLAAFQDHGHLGPAAAERYAALASRAAFHAVLGVQMPPAPAWGLRGMPLALDDPLADEWVVAVTGPALAEAIVARDLGDVSLDRDRRFELVRVTDAELVVEVGRSLLTRVSC